MPDPTITAKIDQTFDVHGDLTTAVTFDNIFVVNDLADGGNLALFEIIALLVKWNAGLIQDPDGRSPADTMNIGKRNHNMFVFREINP